MKKMILTVALLAGLSFANAQTSNPSNPAGKPAQERKHMTPDERSEKDVAWAEKQLGLNATQTSQWKAASLERSSANETLREKMKGATTPEERMQMRGQMKSNSDKFETTVSAFLTAEQKAKFEQSKKERHDRHQKPMKNKTGKQNEPAPNRN